MAKVKNCPHCGRSELKSIGVPGIKQCNSCKELVDVRSSHWLKRLIQELAA